MQYDPDFQQPDGTFGSVHIEHDMIFDIAWGKNSIQNARL
jgi:hypothetical protein